MEGNKIKINKLLPRIFVNQKIKTQEQNIGQAENMGQD
jgi:hypothetical protein|tara:strand:+ start:2310 stop:2423 length:114 start_codon:yes stop_codon:yes gene_type:complete